MLLVKCLLLTASFWSSRKQYKSFTLKNHRHYHQVLQRWDSTNRCMVRTSLIKHTLPLPHPETSRIYLTPSPLARTLYMDTPPPSHLAGDVIYGWLHIRTWDVELNLTKNLNYFFYRVFVTYFIQYSCNLQVVSSFILFEMIPINLIWHDIIFKIIYFDA